VDQLWYAGGGCRADLIDPFDPFDLIDPLDLRDLFDPSDLPDRSTCGTWSTLLSWPS